MAIKQYHFRIRYTKKHKRTIRLLKPLRGNEWDALAKNLQRKIYGLATRRDELKTFIKSQLDLLQGEECAFCGLSLKTRVRQIEHIAPKGAKLHPQFMFESKNLVLACSLCNGFERKSTFDTIVAPHQNYFNCTFNIIHPYFDDPDDHLEYIVHPESNLAFLIQVKEVNGTKSAKGVQTVALFHLDKSGMTEERYKDALAASQVLKPDFENLVNEIKKRDYTI